MSVMVGHPSHPSYLCAKSIQVSRYVLSGILPKLSNSKQIWLSSFLANVLDECSDEIPVDVFDSVEAESGSAITEGRKDPLSPAEEIRENFWVAVVDIGTHWAS